jgi:hypothetical protein
MSSPSEDRLNRVLTLGVIWAMVGLIYSTIFVAMLAFFNGLRAGPMSLGLAASLAGAVGALFYASLRLALLATVAALIAAFGYLAALPMQTVSPLEMLGVSALAGVIVGGHYGCLMKGSRVCRATGKTLAGLYAGFVAGMGLAALAAWSGTLDIAIAIAIAVATALLTPLTGVVYVVAEPRVVAHLCGQPPPVVSGALVGGGVEGLIGIAVWAFAGILSSTVTGDATGAVRYAWGQLPQAALGGMISGSVAGAALAAAGVPLPIDRDLETDTHLPPRGL